MLVYDKEYKTVEDEDSGGETASILEGAGQITLSHDSSFYVEYSKKQEIRVRKHVKHVNFDFYSCFS